MTIDFIPSYVVANEGCFYWGWFPACDLQIFLVLPWLIYAAFSIKNKWAKGAFIVTGVIFGMGLNFWIIWTNKMAAALFAP